MDRRTFAKTAVAALTPLVAGTSHGDEGPVPTIYFVDGYHGGIRGHMVAGSWRDILNRMCEFPSWKVSLDIETETFQYLRQRDPEAYHEIRRYLEDSGPEARMEICGGTYAQPFPWLFNGESLIRQLALGHKILREQFPKVKVLTYATQEPCFTSAMPQVLLSFGYVRAVLKNNTGFAGYMAGVDADVLKWVGPDGSVIPTVPHYACERLGLVWTTDSEGVSEAYARKCVSHGITRPAGMSFQDLGWLAKPRVGGEYVRFVTWREYFETIAPKAEKEWAATQEDIKGNLPWGSATLQAIGAQMRSAEDRLVAAEKMAALAQVLAGSPYPAEHLAEAWKNTLDSQHHDAWVVARNGRGRHNWAWQVGAQTWVTEQICDKVIAGACEALSRGNEWTGTGPLGPRWVRVFNTTAAARAELTEVRLSLDIGTQRVRVLDGAGKEVLCQFVPKRQYVSHDEVVAMWEHSQVVAPTAGLKPSQQWNKGDSAALLGTTGQVVSGAESQQWRSGDPAARGGSMELLPGESLNAGVLLFPAHVPPLGYATYRIDPVYRGKPEPSTGGARAVTEPDGTILIETDRYRVRLDPKRGGTLSSIFDKELRTEFVDTGNERRFNEYRGYFINEKQWLSSASQPVEVEILENGPLRVRMALAGRVGEHPFRACITLANGQPRIDFRVRFQFKPQTWIGDPWRVPPEGKRSERRRSYHDDRWKLNAFFPMALPRQTVYKDAAYDVCRSKLTDTFYQRWDEVKHNIILNWIDVVDEQQDLGMAIFSDLVTTYVHGPQHPPALVLAWGWDAVPFFGDCPLEGEHEAGYSILPHQGRWDKAGLWRSCRERSEPLLAQLADGKPASGDGRSLVSVSGTGVEVPTLMMEGEDLLVRLFNAEGDGEARTVSLAVKPGRAELVELDGRTIAPLPIQRADNGHYEVRLAIPRFGIRTLRFSNVERRTA
jgi:alpha-mannosidase